MCVRRSSLRSKWRRFWGWLCNNAAVIFSRFTGVVTITAELSAVVRYPDGRAVDHGVISRRVVSNGFVYHICGDWYNDSVDITDFEYHASGTGTTAEAASQIALWTEVGTRVVGTKTQPASNQMQAVGTQSFSSAYAITEHGVFKAASGSYLMDRSVFDQLDVISGSEIEWTYTCTFNTGG